MIGYIQGILKEKDYNNVTVDCNGIGYQIMVTNSCMANMPDLEQEVKIYTYLHVREDEMSLYGFVSPEEKRLFLQLITVSGVGSKTALQILSAERMGAIINSIINEDSSVIASCKGIGKKVAEKIIVELKDKIRPLDYILPNESIFTQSNEFIEDAVVVLTSLGLSKNQASKMAREVAKENDTAEDIVAKVLHNMGE
ncbi:MAG TPA: Holliday junction branch migration protein RuvA [Candidatus Onthoplasma faecigallinarum]|nr:Holliday junction branch migration protein RuvA [Candidatus Onthoplasma faecigallinarum]